MVVALALAAVRLVKVFRWRLRGPRIGGGPLMWTSREWQGLRLRRGAEQRASRPGDMDQ